MNRSLFDIKNELKKILFYDMLILDFYSKFYGDEVYIIVEENEVICYKISFINCAKVYYETDAGWIGSNGMRPGDWRGTKKIREWDEPYGYFGQVLEVEESKEIMGYYNIKFHLSLLEGEIICKEINVEKLDRKKQLFFWEKNNFIFFIILIYF